MPDGIRAEVLRLSADDPAIAARVERFEVNEVLLYEGEANSNLFLVLEGELELSKQRPDGPPLSVSRHSAGDLIGVNSFATQNPSFCTARAKTPLSVLRLDEAMIAGLAASYPVLDQFVKELMVANLANRYRAAVSLQIELLESNRELTETRNQLIHKERLALLGNLVAGVAHELNNPASAILRECEHLESVITALLNRSTSIPENWQPYWQAGAQRNPATSLLRQRLKSLEHSHPNIPRAQLRAVASLPIDLEPTLIARLRQSQGAKPAELDIADAAFLLRAVSVSATQITHLVTALKTHARPGVSQQESVNLAESIGNSLVMLGHLAKRHAVECDLDPALAIMGLPGDVNQIWTNLIKNAFEAMGQAGTLRITAHPSGDLAQVTIRDNGPGIPPALAERVFDVNFTTKRGAENFGLGLGLSIARSLVENLDGTIQHRTPTTGGCEFIIELPLSPAESTKGTHPQPPTHHPVAKN